MAKSYKNMFVTDQQNKTARTFNANDLILTILVFIITTSLLVSIKISSIFPIISIIYISIIALLIRNYTTAKYIRIGMALAAILLFFTLFAAIINPIFIGTYSIRLLLIFISIVVFMNLHFSSKTINILSAVMIPIIVYISFKSTSFVDIYLNTNELSAEYINTNPNNMALIILFAYMIADRSNLLRGPFAWLVLTAISFYGLFNYGSRNAMICFVLYMLISRIINHFSYKMKKIILFSVLLFAVIFPVIYVSYYTHSYSDESVVIFNKDIYSGRQNIWISSMETESIHSKLVGNTDLDLLNELPSRSLHNMYIDISYRLGFIYLILFLSFLFYIITRDRNMPDKVYASILILLIYGYFETTFFSGAYAAMLMLLIFIYKQHPVKSNSPNGKKLNTTRDSIYE